MEKRACKLIQPLWRTVWRFLKKLGIKLPYDSAIPLLGTYPEKPILQKVICTLVFTAALFTIARTQKQPRCPLTDERIKKLWYTHIHTRIYTHKYIHTYISWNTAGVQLLSHVSLFATCQSPAPAARESS